MGKFIRLTGMDNGTIVRVSLSKILEYQEDSDFEKGSVVDIGMQGGGVLSVKESPEEIDALIEQAERS